MRSGKPRAAPTPRSASRTCSTAWASRPRIKARSAQSSRADGRCASYTPHRTYRASVPHRTYRASHTPRLTHRASIPHTALLTYHILHTGPLNHNCASDTPHLTYRATVPHTALLTHHILHTGGRCVSHSLGFCSRSRSSSCWTSRPTIWISHQEIGSPATSEGGETPRFPKWDTHTLTRSPSVFVYISRRVLIFLAHRHLEKRPRFPRCDTHPLTPCLSHISAGSYFFPPRFIFKGTLAPP